MKRATHLWGAVLVLSIAACAASTRLVPDSDGGVEALADGGRDGASSDDGRASDARRDRGVTDDATDDDPFDAAVACVNAADASTSCTTFSCTGGSMLVTWNAAVNPPPTQGVIPDGRYRMTNKFYYVGPNGLIDPPHSEPSVWLRIQGGTWDVSTLWPTGPMTQRLTLNATSPFTLASQCGDLVYGYLPSDYSVVTSASGTDLELYWIGGSIIVGRYRKE